MTDTLPARRPPIFFVMLIVLVGVWGYVFYAYARSWAGPTPEVPRTAPASAEAGSAAVTVHAARQPYTADYRDPFAWPPGLHLGTSAAPEAATPDVPASAAVRLQGVVGDVAMLQIGDDPEVYLGRVGETVSGARILAVQVDQVIVRIEGRTVTVSFVP